MGEFDRWDKAIAYLSDYEPGVTIWKMEDLPVVEGQSNPELWYKQAYVNRDLDALKELPEVRYLLDWYPSVEEFFRPHYGDFWWHKKQATPYS